MKICVIGATYPFRGGASHYNTILCSHLIKKHDTTVFSFKRQYPQFLYPGQTDTDPSSSPLVEINSEQILDGVNPLTWFKCAFKLCKIKPDLLLFHWTVSYWTPLYFTICSIVRLFGKTKILIICHNVIEHETKIFSKLCSKLILSYGDYFIVHSAEDEKNLLGILPTANVKKVFHPTYETFNRQGITTNSVAELRSHLNLGKKVILFFGFVRNYKGLEYLLKALPHVLSEIDVTLLIVGEFWSDKGYYEGLIDELNIKENLCVIDRYIPNNEVAKYFNVSDITIIPYISATGSGIVQLSFGFERPVIATKVGCLHEVVVDKKTGFLVEPNDHLAIAEAIKEFYAKPNLESFIENIKNENKKYSWDSMVNAIEKLVNNENCN